MPTAKIYTAVVERLSEKVAARREELALEEERKAAQEEKTIWRPKEDKDLDSTVLSKVDLSLSYTKEEYKEKLKKAPGSYGNPPQRAVPPEGPCGTGV